MCLRLIFVLASLEVMVTSLLTVMVGKLDVFSHVFLEEEKKKKKKKTVLLLNNF